MSLRVPERVYLIRHAETTQPHVFNGYEVDVPLSDFGHRQAVALADWFQPHPPTIVVSSNQIRARQTAQPLVEQFQLPHAIEHDFHERKVGALAGQSFSLQDGPWAETVREWNSGNADFTTEGAESYNEMSERVMAAWQRVMAAYVGQRLAIVAHGVTCKILLLNLLPGHSCRDWVKLGRVMNTSVTELVWQDDQWQAPRLLIVPENIAQLEPGRDLEASTGQVRSEG